MNVHLVTQNDKAFTCTMQLIKQLKPSAGTVITKETKEPNNKVLLKALLFGCIVSFVTRNLCLGTYRRNPLPYGKVTLKRFLTQASTLLEIWQDYREETEKEERGKLIHVNI